MPATSKPRAPERARAWLKTHPTSFAFFLIFLLGAGLRLWGFPDFPAGPHQDEISSGYEAWSMLQTGSDRWGYHLPVYFISWGSGQNVLYAYLTMPFMALFGQTLFTVRIVALLCGIALLPLIYGVGRELYSKPVGLLAMAGAACAPYFILTSHVGIESHIAPTFALAGTLLVLLALRTGQRRYIITSLIPFALCAYAYIIMLIPIGVLLALTLLVSRHQIRQHWRAWLIALMIFALMVLPLGLFIIKNYVVHAILPFEHLLPFSVPMLVENRLVELRNGTSFPPLVVNQRLITNLFNDAAPQNTLDSYPAITLLFLVLFMISIFVGGYKIFHRQFKFNILHATIIGVLPLFALTYVFNNITRINLILAPMIPIASALAYRIWQRVDRKTWRVLMAAVLVVIGFAPDQQLAYHGPLYAVQASSVFNPQLPQALKYVESAAHGKPIYLTAKINGSYIDVLWLNKVSPATFKQYNPTPRNPHFENFYFFDTMPKLQDFYFISVVQHNDLPYCMPAELVDFKPVAGYFVGHCIRGK